MSKSTEASPGDPLKYYCIVFGLLIVVIGVVWFQLRGRLETFRIENARAEAMLTADPQDMDHLNRPRQLSALGLATQRLVAGYSAALGGEGGTRGIPSDQIEAKANEVFIKQNRANSEVIDQFTSRGFEQVQREFTYDPTDLENFSILLWTIENMGRYRVFEVNWRMRPARENSEEPFHLIMGPTIKVGFRRPLASGSGS